MTLKRANNLLLWLSLCLCVGVRIEARAQSKIEGFRLEQPDVVLAKNHNKAILSRYVIGPEDKFPNTALVVVDASNKGSRGASVKGIAYFRTFATPGDSLMGKLIWNESRQQVFLVTLKRSNKHTSFRIFRVGLTKELGKYPLKLDPNDYQKWPDELPELSMIEVDRSRESLCLLKDLNVISEQRTLKITARRENPDGAGCDPLSMNFYLDSLMWSGEALSKLPYQKRTGSGWLELVKIPIKRAGADLT